MNCSQAQYAILLDLDGEVTPARRRALRRHLRGCSACHEILRQHTAIHGAMARLAAISPLARQTGDSPATTCGHGLRWRSFVAAAAVVALCVGGWWIATQLCRERAREMAVAPQGTEHPSPLAAGKIVPPSPAQPVDVRPLVRVDFDPASELIAVPKPTRNPNITVLWIYPAVRTAEAKPAPAIEPAHSQGAHS
jgi:anti-sigma factor RsiW